MGTKSLLKALRMQHLSVTGKGVATLSHEPSRPLPAGLCKPNSGPRIEWPLFEGFSPQGSYPHWEMHGIRHTHTQGTGSSPPWHRETLRALDPWGWRKCSKTHCLSAKRGAEKPHPLWSSALHSRTSPWVLPKDRVVSPPWGFPNSKKICSLENSGHLTSTYWASANESRGNCNQNII